MEVAPRLLKIPKSECPDVWIRLPRQQIMEKHWRSRGTSSTKLERSSISRSALGKTVRRSFDRTWTGESSELGMYVRSSETMVISVGICGWHQNGWTEAEYGSHVEEIDEKRGSWWTHISSWSCVLGVHPAWVQTEWNSHWTVFEDVWVTCFWWSNRKITAVGKNLTHKQWGGPATWKDMLKNAMNDTAKWQTRKWSRSTKFQVLAWMIINSSTKNWNQWENCQKLAHTFLKCLYLARTGRPDISCGQSTSLRDQSRHGLRHVTDAWQGWFLTFITQTISDSIVMWETRHSIADCVCLQDSDFAGDLEDSKSTSGGTLCVFESHTFVSKSWMCKKQTSVSHSSTESEIIFGRRIEIRRYSRSWFMGSDCFSPWKHD